ncbi:male sterility protein-domain-containing protein [Xylaria curta]|nr:male sterility protein-domain-containing protein [Xylaria curta]
MWSISNQENLAEYRTRDLWEPHPVVPDAWRWVARTDDIIVFLNGEKTNPVTMEQSVVASNPGLLVGAIVVGAQRFQAALLVEPAPALKIENTADEAALIERIWPSIEEANSIAPAHARVEKSMVLIGDPKRPLIRAAKGTIQRVVSLAQYSAEIDKLYAAADATEGDNDIMADEMHIPLDRETITQRIRQTVLSTTGWRNIEDSTGFFDSGMDSLQALRIIRALRGALGASHLALSTLYHNPSIARLAEAILLKKSSNSDNDLMQSLLGTYSGLIQQIKPITINSATADDNTDVILTGSTGTLGTQILRALLDRPGVRHIYCLNRGADGGDAVQRKRFEVAGISERRLDNRVTFLQADLAQPFLSLEEDKYETLRSRVGFVIHNAWPVNFNMDLLAFRPQLAGLVNLFALSNAAAASGGKKKMKFLFVSSVGVVIDGTSGNAPEALVELPNKQDGSSSSNGYSKSKLLAEHLCDVAARHLDTSVLVARVGQVAGAISHKGVWNPAEWLPSLVMSSRHLGCLPDNLGPRFSTVDWVPVDALADVVVDLATYHPMSNSGGDVAKGSAEGTRVRNIRNPAVVSWEDVLPAIKEGIEDRGTIEVVSAGAWLHRLEKSVEATAGDTGAIAANPAIKLIEFYKNSLWNSAGPISSKTAPMAIEKTLDASPTLRDLPPVSTAWMRKWVDEWLVEAAGRKV